MGLLKVESFVGRCCLGRMWRESPGRQGRVWVEGEFDDLG
jgi:hypothetical protein